MVANLLEFEGALSYLASRHAILQKIASGQPLTTFLTRLNSWIERGGRMRKAMMVQEKVCQYSDFNHNLPTLYSSLSIRHL